MSFPPHVTVVATSRFCAEKLAARMGRPVPAIEPYVERNNYVTVSTGKYVTFVNPVEMKGLDIAWRDAAVNALRLADLSNGRHEGSS
jgi:hypothetical protein